VFSQAFQKEKEAAFELGENVYKQMGEEYNKIGLFPRPTGHAVMPVWVLQLPRKEIPRSL